VDRRTIQPQPDSESDAKRIGLQCTAYEMSRNIGLNFAKLCECVRVLASLFRSPIYVPMRRNSNVVSGFMTSPFISSSG
jgi:hypothetical protein